LPAFGSLLPVVMVRSSVDEPGAQRRPVAFELTPTHIAMKIIATSAMKKM